MKKRTIAIGIGTVTTLGLAFFNDIARYVSSDADAPFVVTSDYFWRQCKDIIKDVKVPETDDYRDALEDRAYAAALKAFGNCVSSTKAPAGSIEVHDKSLSPKEIRAFQRTL